MVSDLGAKLPEHGRCGRANLSYTLTKTAHSHPLPYTLVVRTLPATPDDAGIPWPKGVVQSSIRAHTCPSIDTDTQ
jgi:hypothetical protein